MLLSIACISYGHASMKPIHFLILFYEISIQYDYAIIYFLIFVQGVIYFS